MPKPQSSRALGLCNNIMEREAMFAFAPSRIRRYESICLPFMFVYMLCTLQHYDGLL